MDLPSLGPTPTMVAMPLEEEVVVEADEKLLMLRINLPLHSKTVGQRTYQTRTGKTNEVGWSRIVEYFTPYKEWENRGEDEL